MHPTVLMESHEANDQFKGTTSMTVIDTAGLGGIPDQMVAIPKVGPDV